MSHHERLKRSPQAFRSLTGLTPEAFDSLLAQVEPAWRDAQSRRRERPNRRRKPGAGPKHSLGVADQLLMLLIYYRTYVSHAFLAFLFGVDDSTVCRNFRILEPLLAGIFRIPERKVEMQEEAEALLLGQEEAAHAEEPDRRRAQAQEGGQAQEGRPGTEEAPAHRGGVADGAGEGARQEDL
jgi:hypothetical protein